jgi:hypothetical protein
MAGTSKTEFARLLNDDELGEKAYYLDIVSRWSSLRILNFMFSKESATTGEIARGVNMDMREVQEILDPLEEVGAIERVGEDETSKWTLGMRELRIELSGDQSLNINLSIDPTPPQSREEDCKTSDTSIGFFAKIGKRLDSTLHLD